MRKMGVTGIGTWMKARTTQPILPAAATATQRMDLRRLRNAASPRRKRRKHPPFRAGDAHRRSPGLKVLASSGIHAAERSRSALRDRNLRSCAAPEQLATGAIRRFRFSFARCSDAFGPPLSCKSCHVGPLPFCAAAQIQFISAWARKAGADSLEFDLFTPI
jgi:hypothetical protein